MEKTDKIFDGDGALSKFPLSDNLYFPAIFLMTYFFLCQYYTASQNVNCFIAWSNRASERRDYHLVSYQALFDFLQS